MSSIQAAIYDLRREIVEIKKRLAPVSSSAGAGLDTYTRNNDGRHDCMRIFMGRITDTCPDMNSYRVDVPNAERKVCTVINLCGTNMTAVGGYAPGDYVLVAGSTTSTVGLILGRIPERTTYGEFDLKYFVSQSDQFKPDAFNKSFYQMIQDINNESPEWSMHSPFKRVDCSEFRIGSGSGPQLFVDPFMATLSVHDATGVWAFRDDSLLRIAGLNYQVITSGTSEERFNEKGDCNEYSGHVLNSWEALGYYEKPTEIMTKIPWWDKSDDPMSFIEPVDLPDGLWVKPYQRIMEFGGWYGQGKQSHIIGPPPKVEKKNNTLYNDDGSTYTVENPKPAFFDNKEEKQPCLSRMTQHFDGYMSLESAQGLSIVKRGRIPATQRLQLSDDPKYDTDYSHTGWNKQPGAPEHQGDKKHYLMQSIMAVDDYRTYNTNFKTIRAILKHEEKWFIPEESKIYEDCIFDLNKEIEQLKEKTLIEIPKEYKVKLEGSEKYLYYPVEAGIHLLPDGGVVIHDGYGSELRMSGGQITLSAPGGVWIRSGKEVNIWGGSDVNMRAKKCMDISTTEGSLRVKAEKNLELLGGNEESKSGVVIESRGSGDLDFSEVGEKIETGGIIIRADRGTITTLASTIYTRAGVEGGGNGIMLDARRNNIYTASTEKLDYVSNRHVFNFGDFESKDVEKCQESRKDQFTLPGAIACDKGATFQEDVLIKTFVKCGRHILTKDAVMNKFVSPLTGLAAAMFDEKIDTDHTYNSEELPEEQKEFRSEDLEEDFYEENKPGNDTVIEQAEFSFRTEDDLQLNEFFVYEDRWQTICTVGATWSENKVTTYNGEGEYPYPGKKYFEDEPCLVTQSQNLVDDRLIAKDRKVGSYEEPKYNEPDIKSLKKYRVL